MNSPFIIRLRFTYAILVAVLVPSFCARAEVASGTSVESLTGHHTRLVWTRMATEGKDDLDGQSQEQVLAVYDSRDAKGVRMLSETPSNYSFPLISGDGEIVVYTRRADENDIRAIRFSGGLTKNLTTGIAVATWQDPKTDKPWVYALRDFDEANKTAGQLVRFPLADAEALETLHSGEPRLQIDRIDVTADGSFLVATQADGTIGRLDTASKTWSSVGITGSCPSVLPTGKVWGLTNKGLSAEIENSDATVALDKSVRKGWKIDHVTVGEKRIVALTGPYRFGMTAASEVRIGRLSESLAGVDEWLQITEDYFADYRPSVWVGTISSKKAIPIDGQTSAPKSPDSSSPPKATQVSGKWPVTTQGAVIQWENHAKGSHRTVKLKPHNQAIYGPNYQARPSGGELVFDEISSRRVDAVLSGGKPSTIEFLLSGGPTRSGTSGIFKSKNLVIAETEGVVFSLRRQPDGQFIYLWHCKVDASRAPKSIVLISKNTSEAWFVDGKRAEIKAPLAQAIKPPPIRLADDDLVYLCGNMGIERFGIYDRLLSGEEIAAIAETNRVAMDARKPLEYSQVRAVLLAASEIPHPALLGDLPGALATHRYRVETVKAGEKAALSGKEIIVLHRVVVNKRPIVGFPREIGKTYAIGLEPASDHPELVLDKIADDLKAASLPYFLEVAIRVDSPDQKEKNTNLDDRQKAQLAKAIRDAKTSREEAQKAMALQAKVNQMEAAMRAAADRLDYERAILIRDEWVRLKAAIKANQ